jgi:hypothetical protein
MHLNGLILPMVLGLVGSIYFVFFTEEDWKWKGLASGTMIVSLLLQFIPALQVPFIIPLVLQGLVAVWMVIYWKLDR